MEWQPIKSAPKGQTILAFAKVDNCNFITVAFWQDERWFMLDSCSHSLGFRAVQPTHWMPLPNPPAV